MNLMLTMYELDKLNFENKFVLHASSAIDLANSILVNRLFGRVAMLIRNDLATKVMFVS